jgi:hypothetical protein
MYCEGSPSQSAVWGDNQGNLFYNCPLKWVGENIYEWYQEVLYVTEFGCALPYSDQCPNFLNAWILYKNYKDRYDSYLLEKMSGKHGSSNVDDNLNRMTQVYMEQQRNKHV